MSELVFGVITPVGVDSIPNEQEAKVTANELFLAISKQHTAPVIAANQIGIDQRVIACVVEQPIYLINPVIIEAQQPFAYLEAHSSYPNQLWTTIRYSSILVTADNMKEPIRFGLKPEHLDKLFSNGNLNMVVMQHPVIMQACYIQQAIDTLNGVMPEARKPKITDPVIKPSEPTRNQTVILEKDGEQIQIKYKKIKPYLETGWELKTV